MARDGDVLAAGRFTAPGGFGAVCWRPGELRQGARRVRQRRDDSPPGPAPAVAATDRVLPAARRGPRLTRPKSTPTSLRLPPAASTPTTTSTTSSSFRSAARSAGVIHRPRSTCTRCATSPGADTRRPCAAGRPTEPIHRHRPPARRRALPAARMAAPATALGGTTIHVTVGVEAVNRFDLVRSRCCKRSKPTRSCARPFRSGSTSPTQTHSLRISRPP